MLCSDATHFQDRTRYHSRLLVILLDSFHIHLSSCHHVSFCLQMCCQWLLMLLLRQLTLLLVLKLLLMTLKEMSMRRR